MSQGCPHHALPLITLKMCKSRK